MCAGLWRVPFCAVWVFRAGLRNVCGRLTLLFTRPIQYPPRVGFADKLQYVSVHSPVPGF